MKNHEKMKSNINSLPVILKNSTNSGFMDYSSSKAYVKEQAKEYTKDYSNEHSRCLTPHSTCTPINDTNNTNLSDWYMQSRQNNGKFYY